MNGGKWQAEYTKPSGNWSLCCGMDSLDEAADWFLARYRELSLSPDSPTEFRRTLTQKALSPNSKITGEDDGGANKKGE